MISAKYVKLPIDPNSVKQKVILGLTKRQIISFLIGGACGIIPFFITKEIAQSLCPRRDLYPGYSRFAYSPLPP